MSHVDAEGVEEECTNEYEVLKNVLSGYEANVNEMQTVQHRYKMNKKTELIQRLLRGDGSWNQMESDLHEAGVVLDGNVFCVVGFSFNHINTLKSVYSWEDMKIFCFTMVNILEEYLSKKGYTVYGVEDENYSVCLILQLEKAYENSDEYRSEMFPFFKFDRYSEIIIWCKRGIGKSIEAGHLLCQCWAER